MQVKISWTAHAFMLASLLLWTNAISAPCPPPQPGSGATLKTPNGCEAFRVGDTMEITWELEETGTGLVVLFSPDGETEFTIFMVLPTSPLYERGPYRWVIPDSVFSADGFSRSSTISDQCVIRIHDYWAVGVGDAADRAISISPASTRVAPRTGTLLVRKAGANQERVFATNGRTIRQGFSRGKAGSGLYVKNTSEVLVSPQGMIPSSTGGQ